MKHTDWLSKEEYPFQSHFLPLPMGRLHYVDEGAGEPVVLVHGNPAWSFLYRHLIKQLAPHYRCVAPDHIGFGLSDKPRDWTYLPDQHAHNLAALIESLGLKDITLVVQDWGGPLGLAYAINHPANVKRLIIMNTWLWPVNEDWYYRAFSAFTGGFIGRYLIRQHNFFVNGIMPQAYGNRARFTSDIQAHYQQPLAVPAERKGCWVFPGQIIGSTPWLADLWARRAQLKPMSKLIVWGMKDIAFREHELKVWESAFPEAHVIRLENVGHFVPEEAVSELGEAARTFLGQSSPTRP